MLTETLNEEAEAVAELEEVEEELVVEIGGEMVNEDIDLVLEIAGENHVRGQRTHNNDQKVGVPGIYF